MTNFEKVGLFMSTFGQEVKKKSDFSTEKINSLRISLIKEELDELTKAIAEKEILHQLHVFEFSWFNRNNCVSLLGKIILAVPFSKNICCIAM